MKKTTEATGGAVNGENHGTAIWTELDLVQDCVGDTRKIHFKLLAFVFCC